MKNQSDKQVNPYTICRDLAKFAGTRDIEKLFWQEHLSYCEYNDTTNYVFWGYLEGVGIHDREWMMEKRKELIGNGNFDFIRFVNVLSYSELNDLIIFCIKKEINLQDKFLFLYVFDAFINFVESKTPLLLSEEVQLFFINLLPEIINQGKHLTLFYSGKAVYNLLIPNLLSGQSIEEAAKNKYKVMRDLRRKQLEEEKKCFAKEIVDLFEIRFPIFKTTSAQQKRETIASLFKPLLGDFLDQHRNEISCFSQSFPSLHEIFFKPLEMDASYRESFLYLFFCEPIFYRDIFFWIYFLKKKKSYCIENLKYLESFFSKFSEKLGTQNYEIFLRKIKDFMGLIKPKKKNGLPDIVQKTCSLYGEMKCIDYAINDFSDKGNLNIAKFEIPDESNSNKGKMCDVRLYSSDNKGIHFFESKYKIPGYGVEDSKSVLNDYLMNYIPLFSAYCTLFFPELDFIHLFPRLIFSHEQSYGRASDLVEAMLAKGFNVFYKKDDLKIIDVERNLLIEILSYFYDDEFSIENAHPLPAKQEVISGKMQLVDILLNKKFIPNTIKNSFEQFKYEIKRAKESNLLIGGFTLCWTLSIPYGLIDWPFFEDSSTSVALDTNIKERILSVFKDILNSGEFPELKDQDVRVVFL